MEDRFLFSIVDFEMYVNDNPKDKWFDIDEIEIVNVKAQIIPLFNTTFHEDRDNFDDTVFPEFMIVISVLEFDGEDYELSRELVSYEYLLEPKEGRENIYEANLEINFDDIKKNIQKHHYYNLSISYYIKDREYSNLFYSIINNMFHRVTIPFIEDGGWINGRK